MAGSDFVPLGESVLGESVLGESVLGDASSGEGTDSCIPSGFCDFACLDRHKR